MGAGIEAQQIICIQEDLLKMHVLKLVHKPYMKETNGGGSHKSQIFEKKFLINNGGCLIGIQK